MMTQPEISDAELIQRIRDGDESAFRPLFDRYIATLTRQIERRLSPPLRRKVGASDVLQDAYLVALQRLSTLDDPDDGGFERWLRKIVDHKTRDVVRRFAGTGRRAIGREVSRDARPASGAFAGRIPTPS